MTKGLDVALNIAGVERILSENSRLTSTQFDIVSETPYGSNAVGCGLW